MRRLTKILIIKGSSQYDAARCFCDEIMRAFCSLGCLVTMLDLTSFPTTNNFELFSQYDMIFSFDLAGIELYNIMSVKPFFWSFLIDPPFYLNERLKRVSGNVMVSCIDQSHVSYIDKYYKNVRWTCFMPHGGLTGEYPSLIPYNEREYNTVIVGSYQPLDHIETVINPLKKDYDPLLSEIIVDALNDLSSDLTTIVYNKIYQTINDFDERIFREFMYLIRAVDALRRNYKRTSLIKGLIQNNLSVDIWGAGWEHLDIISQNKNLLRLHGTINYNEVKYVLRNSKILLNDLPFYYNGSHERVFMGMQCGTIVATEKSNFFEECFKKDAEIIFYNSYDIKSLVSTVGILQEDEKSAKHIIDNAYNISIDHTWASRAYSIMEIFEKKLSY